MQKKKINILLVEDDFVDVKNVKRTFAKEGIEHPLFIAKDGVEALEMLHGQNGHAPLIDEIDIILLDINMPRMNGLEFLAEIRKNPKLEKTFVFIITTSDDDRDKSVAAQYNVSGYFIKPIQGDVLTNILSTFSNYWELVQN